MRAFIAIELPQKIKDKLARFQMRLKKSGADVKWVAPENIHLTLKFLGEIAEEKSAKIFQIIEEITDRNKQLQLRLAAVGVFPKIEFPRVIWLAIDKGDNEVKILAKTLEEEIAKLGIPKENRPFSSHITIGRIRSALNRDKLIKILKESENYFAKEKFEFSVTRITLFKSTLGPSGPVYAPLKATNINTA